ncbi:MAG: hypothetical protein PHP93_05615 [Kiritimatiellales bacterium]|nr:hypothetical protein [Kiritimatiellales bacterium]
MTNTLHIIVDSLPSVESSWVTVLSALLVPAITVVAVYIAYQQYQINKSRLRHETYERRLAVYKCVQRYLLEILREGKTTYDQALKFYSEASEAAFLFDPSVQEKIDQIYEKSIEMEAEYEKMYPADKSPGLPVGDERSVVCKKNADLLKWHINELRECRPFFAKKLGLKIT